MSPWNVSSEEEAPPEWQAGTSKNVFLHKSSEHNDKKIVRVNFPSPLEINHMLATAQKVFIKEKCGQYFVRIVSFVAF